MKLFDPQPRITAADRERITAATSNAQTVRQWLKTNPSQADVKKAIIIECERTSERGQKWRDGLTHLIRRHSSLEQSALIVRITKHLAAKNR